MDSTEVNLLNKIGDKFISINTDSALKYGQKFLALAQTIGYKTDISNGYFYNGTFWIGGTKGVEPNIEKGLEYFRLALKIDEELGNKYNILVDHQYMRSVYIKEGNYPEALKNELAALKIAEETKNKLAIIYGQNAVGTIYQHLGNNSEALRYYEEALKLAIVKNDSFNIGQEKNNMGVVYATQGNYNVALINYNEALKINEHLNDTIQIAINIGGIVDLDVLIGNYREAAKNYQKALSLYEQKGNQTRIAETCNEFGALYEKIGDLKNALTYETRGLSLAMKMEMKDQIKESYKNLAHIYSKLGNYKAAYDNEVLFKQYYDSIYNKENEKKLTSLQMQYDFDKKQDSIKSEQVKKDALTTKEIEDQKRIRNYILGGLGIVLFFLIFVFIQRNKIAKEKNRSDGLLLNILPSEVAEELKEKGSAEAKSFDDVTVIFTDFKSFTAISEKLTAKELVSEIDYCFKGFDAIIEKYGIEKIKTIGDSYMAAGGLPVANKTHAKDVMNAALEIIKFMENHKYQRIKENEPVFEIRIGINTGPVVAGIVGVKKFAYDIWGDTVNLASRMESSGEPGRVNISGSTYELVKNDFTCTYRGKIQAKNKGEVDMYFIN
jgi:adenylate cyclase